MSQHHRLGAADHHLHLGAQLSAFLRHQREFLADGRDRPGYAVVLSNLPELTEHARVGNRRHQVRDDVPIHHCAHIDSDHEQPIGEQLRYERAPSRTANARHQNPMLSHVPMVQSSIRTGS